MFFALIRLDLPILQPPPGSPQVVPPRGTRRSAYSIDSEQAYTAFGVVLRAAPSLLKSSSKFAQSKPVSLCRALTGPRNTGARCCCGSITVLLGNVCCGHGARRYRRRSGPRRIVAAAIAAC